MRALVDLLGGAGPQPRPGDTLRHHLGLGLFVVAAANAILMAPVAMALAAEFGASPYPFAISGFPLRPAGGQRGSQVSVEADFLGSYRLFTLSIPER